MVSPLGAEGNAWMWQLAGSVSVKELKTEISLKDLTGFDGRCDAIYFTTEKIRYHRRIWINFQPFGDRN